MTVVGVTSASHRSPRCKLPHGLRLHLAWSSGVKEELDFVYNKSGAERDTHQAAGRALIFKTHPAPAPNKESTNFAEWQAFQANDALPLPGCYGYFRMEICGTLVEALFMDRIAYTGEES